MLYSALAPTLTPRNKQVQDDSKGVEQLEKIVADNFTHPSYKSLWPHQKLALEAIYHHAKQGNNVGFLNMATGTGKTITYLSLVQALKVRTLIVVPTSILVEQTVQAVERYTSHRAGVWTGIKKQAGHYVTVTTYSSFQAEASKVLASKGKTSSPLVDTPYGAVILDEAHQALSGKRANSFRETFLQREPRPFLLGCTATPEYDTLRPPEAHAHVRELLPTEMYSFPILKAVDEGALTPFRILRVRPDLKLDLKAIRTTTQDPKKQKDYSDRQIERTINFENANLFIADLIAEGRDPTTQKPFAGQTGVLFAAGIQHASDIVAAINKRMGAHYAAVISGKTPKKVQKNLLARHARGEITLLCNADILTVGYDCPADSIAIDVRPSFSKVRKLQVFGRILRKDPKQPAKLATFVEIDWKGVEQRFLKDYLQGVLARGSSEADATAFPTLEGKPSVPSPIFYEIVSPEAIRWQRRKDSPNTVTAPYDFSTEHSGKRQRIGDVPPGAPTAEEIRTKHEEHFPQPPLHSESSLPFCSLLAKTSASPLEGSSLLPENAPFEPLFTDIGDIGSLLWEKPRPPSPNEDIIAKALGAENRHEAPGISETTRPLSPFWQFDAFELFNSIKEGNPQGAQHSSTPFVSSWDGSTPPEFLDLLNNEEYTPPWEGP